MVGGDRLVRKVAVDVCLRSLQHETFMLPVFSVPNFWHLLALDSVSGISPFSCALSRGVSGACDGANRKKASLLQAGRKFCRMLVGASASSASVPAEHAIVLAQALRDHLVACTLSLPESAQAAKQRKKRKQKDAPALVVAQVVKSAPGTCKALVGADLTGEVTALAWPGVAMRSVLGVQKVITSKLHEGSMIPAGFGDARGLGSHAAGPCFPVPGARLGAQSR